MVIKSDVEIDIIILLTNKDYLEFLVYRYIIVNAALNAPLVFENITIQYNNQLRESPLFHYA